MEHLTMRQPDDALQNFQEAVKRDPNDPVFHEAVASIYVGQGDLDATFTALSKAADLRTHVKDCVKPDPYFYLGTTYALRFLQTGGEADAEAAIKWLRKATEIRHDFSYAHQALGTVYWALRKADEALASYEQAIKYDPKEPKNYTEKAWVYFDLSGNNDAALETLKQALSIKPDYAEAHYQRGLVYRRLRDDVEALKHLLDAIKYDAKYLNAHLEVAALFREQKNYSESARYLNKTMVFAPTDFRLHKEFAKLHEAQGQNENATEYYRKAINVLRPVDVYIKEVFQCRIERLQGRYDEAVSCFQKLKLPPKEDPGTKIFEIGLTYVASKSEEAARTQFEQLKAMKSPLAQELLRQINEMK
jgi:tetratricopeptide (TPR) repeat protein